MSSAGAIGFFDSGVGGLSVLRHALRVMGGRPLLYVADSAHAPYGRRQPAEVVERSRLICRFLLEQGAQCIVVACNTATAIAVDALRAEFALPIVGMEPALKPAAALSRSGKVAVLATPGTLSSGRFARLVSDHGRDVQIHRRFCPNWVEAVEEGEFDAPYVYDLVNAELAPLARIGVDTFVLGCTHFPFLEAVIRRVVGDQAALVDPGPAVVRQACRRLGIDPLPGPVSPVSLFSSGQPEILRRQAAALIDLHAPAEPLPF